MQAAQLSVFYYNGGELGTNFGSLVYGQKLGPGVFALSLSYLDGGMMDLNFSGGGTQNVSSQQDIIGSLSYAMTVSKNIDIGLSAKGFTSTLMGTLSGQAICADAGVQVKNVLVENLNLGAAILNLGTGIKYLNTAELLPTNISGGVSYSLAVEKMVFLAAVDGIAGLNDNKNYMIVGTEVNYESYAIRAGLPLFSVLDTLFSAGIGYKMDEYSFDYSVTFGKTLAPAHRISVSMLFGMVKEVAAKETPIQDKGPSEYKNIAPKAPAPEKKPGLLKKEIKK